jgi:alkanesulfonate monooxygenase SsuD/methylene tetrahydromethanopterin reductase-like flavin-dependent oxidoreductase (luciferase family)
MHLAQFLCHGPTYHSLAMWRHPRTAAAGFDWARPELYQHIARVCERGKFDMVFFADLNYISDTYRGTMDPAIRHATQAPEHDPIPLLSFMAAVTTRIGLGATFSISHSHPFYAARLWATLDHLTRGHAAWNVVTSLNHNQSANYGEERRPTDERYDRAHEFIEVCRKLWDSWEADAVVMDRAAGVFADPSRVHRIEHEADSSRSRGRSTWCAPRRAARRSSRRAPPPRGGRSRRGTRTRSSRSSRTSRAPRRTTTTSRRAP